MNKQLPLPFFFNPEHDFEEFYAGGNAEVVRHLQLTAQGQGDGLIHVWGEPGLGKTHLLHASCREASRAGLFVSYIPLRLFGDYGCGMLEGLEDQDLVCLDDIEAVAGDKDWEYGLFHLFNRLRDSGHRLITTAPAPPDSIGLTLPDLQTRLSWGLTLMLRPLDDKDKLAALSMRAKQLGLELSPAVGRYLLSKFRRDLPGLLSLMDELDSATLAAKRKLTIPFVKQLLEVDP